MTEQTSAPVAPIPEAGNVQNPAPADVTAEASDATPTTRAPASLTSKTNSTVGCSSKTPDPSRENGGDMSTNAPTPVPEQTEPANTDTTSTSQQVPPQSDKAAPSAPIVDHTQPGQPNQQVEPPGSKPTFRYNRFVLHNKYQNAPGVEKHQLQPSKPQYPQYPQQPQQPQQPQYPPQYQAHPPPHQQYQPPPQQQQRPPLGPPPPPLPSFAPESYNPSQRQLRDQLYSILGELDPYKVTPKEFVSLLIHAAIRDTEITNALFRMNYDRLRDPSSWQPAQPFQQQNAYPRPPYAAMPPAGPVGPGGPPVGAQGGPWGPQQYPPQYPPQYQQPYQGYYANVPMGYPQPGAPDMPESNKRKREAEDEHPSKPPAAYMGRFLLSKWPETLPPGPKAPPPPEEEPYEAAANFTWALDRAETHLNFTGRYDGLSEARQNSVGFDAALRVQKIMKHLNLSLTKNVTFVNRVHILTVMREIMAATLEAPDHLGKEVRRCAREYDNNYLQGLEKLSRQQLGRLKALENGKWMQEMQALVDEANKQSMFPLMNRALEYINSAD